MNDQPKKVVTRFAPSPTGFMHVGGVRTALFGWLWARKNNGTFILRLEDTDKAREVEGSLNHIIMSLKWLGLNWDEGPDIGGEHAPYKQSERLDTYKKYAQELIDKGFAYADPYSEEEVETFRKQAEADKKPFLYRNHRPENPPAWDGTQPLRFKTPIKKYVWKDTVRGNLEAGEEAVDDFVLIKSDGYPTYNFAHIIDDLLMGVTHIFRADEFISSTPKFLALYEALGIEHPEFVTLPPILRDAGDKKLGKRDGAKDILDYRMEGYLSEAMFNFLAFIGWNPGNGDTREVLTQKEIIDLFELEHIQKGGAKFNEEKLEWLNKEHMKLMPEEARNTQIQKVLAINPAFSENKVAQEKLEDGVFMSKLYPIIFDRISKWSDVNTLVDTGELAYFFEKPIYNNAILSWKGQSNEDIRKHLTWVRDTLASASDDSFSDIEKIKSLIFDYATEQGRGNVLWPTRVALSGRDKSPDPFTLIYILGKAESLTRIETALKR
jgi:glutamyl-tRNA synthetase